MPGDASGQASILSIFRDIVDDATMNDLFLDYTKLRKKGILAPPMTKQDAEFEAKLKRQYHDRSYVGEWHGWNERLKATNAEGL